MFVKGVAAALAFLVVYAIGKTIYNVFFHPLAKYPGPKLAAVSRIWLWTKEMRGDLNEYMTELHRKHGPIVRITADEVSFFDIDAYVGEVYTTNTKFSKASYFYGDFNRKARNIFTELDRATHSAEKRLFSHAFSRRNLLGMQDMINANTQRWVEQLRSSAREGAWIALWDATRCLTLDTIATFSYGSPEGGLDQADFNHEIFEVFNQVPIFAPAMQLLPGFPAVMRTISTLYPKFFQSRVNEGAVRGMERLMKQKKKGEDTDGLVMFESIMQKAEKNNTVLDPERMVSNGGIMLFAGTETTALALSTAIFHMTKQPDLWLELDRQLRAALPEGSVDEYLDITALEKVPLLEAVAKESMRVSCPISGRAPRIVPEGGWQFQGEMIPAGTIVTSTQVFYCHDPNVFPEPEKFDVSRWLVDDHAVLSQRNRNLVVFSTGSRSCIGQNLAHIELRLAIAKVVLNFRPDVAEDEQLTFHAYSGITGPNSMIKVKLSDVKS